MSVYEIMREGAVNMAKKTKQKDNSKKAGLIAFGATLLAYALIFPFNKLGHFITGGLLAAAAHHNLPLHTYHQPTTMNIY